MKMSNYDGFEWSEITCERADEMLHSIRAVGTPSIFTGKTDVDEGYFLREWGLPEDNVPRLRDERENGVCRHWHLLALKTLRTQDTKEPAQ